MRRRPGGLVGMDWGPMLVPLLKKNLSVTLSHCGVTLHAESISTEREFTWEISQHALLDQTRTRVAWELTSESLHESFLNFHCLIKGEQELHESWEARVYMRVFSTFIAWSNENKSCMRVDKRKFTWEFSQHSLLDQTRTRVTWELLRVEQCIYCVCSQNIKIKAIFMKYISTCMFIILNENSIVSFSIQYLDRIPQHNTTTVCPSDQYSRWRVFRLHTICTPDELVESREFWRIRLTITQNQMHEN